MQQGRGSAGAPTNTSYKHMDTYTYQMCPPGARRRSSSTPHPPYAPPLGQGQPYTNRSHPALPPNEPAGRPSAHTSSLYLYPPPPQLLYQPPPPPPSASTRMPAPSPAPPTEAGYKYGYYPPMSAPTRQQQRSRPPAKLRSQPPPPGRSQMQQSTGTLPHQQQTTDRQRIQRVDDDGGQVDEKFSNQILRSYRYRKDMSPEELERAERERREKRSMLNRKSNQKKKENKERKRLAALEARPQTKKERKALQIRKTTHLRAIPMVGCYPSLKGIPPKALIEVAKYIPRSSQTLLALLIVNGPARAKLVKDSLCGTSERALKEHVRDNYGWSVEESDLKAAGDLTSLERGDRQTRGRQASAVIGESKSTAKKKKKVTKRKGDARNGPALKKSKAASTTTVTPTGRGGSIPPKIRETPSIAPSDEWRVVWSKLKYAGWYLKYGSGLMTDYYYILPGRDNKKGYVEGVDYFFSEQEVRDYCEKEYGWDPQGAMKECKEKEARELSAKGNAKAKKEATGETKEAATKTKAKWKAMEETNVEAAPKIAKTTSDVGGPRKSPRSKAGHQTNQSAGLKGEDLDESKASGETDSITLENNDDTNGYVASGKQKEQQLPSRFVPRRASTSPQEGLSKDPPLTATTTTPSAQSCLTPQADGPKAPRQSNPKRRTPAPRAGLRRSHRINACLTCNRPHKDTKSTIVLDHALQVGPLRLRSTFDDGTCFAPGKMCLRCHQYFVQFGDMDKKNKFLAGIYKSPPATALDQETITVPLSGFYKTYIGDEFDASKHGLPEVIETLVVRPERRKNYNDISARGKGGRTPSTDFSAYPRQVCRKGKGYDAVLIVFGNKAGFAFVMDPEHKPGDAEFLNDEEMKQEVCHVRRPGAAGGVNLPGNISSSMSEATEKPTTVQLASSQNGVQTIVVYEGKGGRAKSTAIYNDLSGRQLTQDMRKEELKICPTYKRFTLAEMKCRIVAEGVICHLGFEPEVAKGASEGAWLAVLRRIMDDGASFEEALLEWSAMSGEYRNRQWLAAHEDGKVNEGNGYEIISLLGKRSGHLMFPGDDLMLHYRPGVDCVVANLHKVLHMSDNKRGVGNWSKVTGPPCV